MQNISLYVHQAGKGRVPRGWYRKKTINIQRLYYIKSGTGYMIDEKKNKIRFVPGCIYLFPNNYNQEFVTDPDDTIDHLYIDFNTTPPIIGPSPLVYKTEESPELLQTVKLLDILLVERSTEPGHSVETPKSFGFIQNAESGSYEEYKQLLHTLIFGFLIMLSRQGEISFSEDKVISESLEYIREHYEGDIDIEMLSKHFGYSVHHFIRRFHSVMGTTPYAYIRYLRLIKAQELISEGETLAKAAGLVGYESASSLSRALRDMREERE